MSDSHEQLQAALLTLVIVTSVMAIGVAFAGNAAAAASSLNVTDINDNGNVHPDGVILLSGSADSGNEVTFELADGTGNTDTVTFTEGSSDDRDSDSGSFKFALDLSVGSVSNANLENGETLTVSADQGIEFGSAETTDTISVNDFEPNEILVDRDSDTGQTHTGIQAGIDAAGAGPTTIVVQADEDGSYSGGNTITSGNSETVNSRTLSALGDTVIDVDSASKGFDVSDFTTGDSTSLTIEGFRIEVATDAGIDIKNGSGLNNATIRSNTIDVESGANSPAQAIILTDTDDVDIDDNTITGQPDSDQGVLATTSSSGPVDQISSVSVTNNNITEFGIGVVALASSGDSSDGNGDISDINVSNNTFDNSTDAINFVEDGGTISGSLEANQNSFENGVDAGVLAGDGGNFDGSGTVGSTVDATSNWWGSSDGPGDAGPGSGANVSSGITFRPFYTDAELTQLSGEKIKNVVTDNTFSSLQNAVDNASAGETLEVQQDIQLSSGVNVTTPGITINGSNAGVNVTLNGNDAGVGDGDETIEVNVGATIRDLTVKR
ncbi:MAG: hypothetical protein ABEI52_05310, partial [Halobacteriaceae archaeon]